MTETNSNNALHISEHQKRFLDMFKDIPKATPEAMRRIITYKSDEATNYSWYSDGCYAYCGFTDKKLPTDLPKGIYQGENISIILKDGKSFLTSNTTPLQQK